MSETTPEDDPRHGWVTVAEARAVWPTAPKVDNVLIRMLAAAHEMCTEYAPQLADGQAVPQRYREAQIMQARAIWRATRDSTTSEDMGGGDYEITTPTLTGRIMQLLRPPSMNGLVG